MKLRSLLIALLLPVVVNALDEAPVYLQYRLDAPVAQRSRVTVEMTEQHPDGPVYTTAFQDAEAEVHLDKLPKSPPYFLTVTLQRVRVGQEVGGKSVTFDSESPEGSPFVAALAKVIGEPVQISVGEQLQIIRGSPELQRLMKDLKAMDGFNMQSFIAEMVQQRFALANQPLEAGKSYQQVLKQGASDKAPVALTYRIVEISPTEVRALVEGQVPALTMAWGGDFSAVKVTGSIEGKVVWNRENAMLYRAKLNYLYRGVVDENGRDLPFQLQLTHQDVSQLL